MTTTSKRCGRCQHTKTAGGPDSDFGADKNRKDGFNVYCKPCNRANSAKYATRPDATAARHADQLLQRRMARAAVFAWYGTTCTCCGTTRNLVIEHANNDGREQRHRLFGRQDGGCRYYLWLITQGFPGDLALQTHCQPCNASKRTGASCRLDHCTAPGTADQLELTA